MDPNIQIQKINDDVFDVMVRGCRFWLRAAQLIRDGEGWKVQSRDQFTVSEEYCGTLDDALLAGVERAKENHIYRGTVAGKR